MTTYLSRYIRYLGPLLGLSALLLANQVHALGLGSLKVLSALDEPLVAEIELTAVEDGALESLQVILGSQEAFNQAGIRRESFLRDLEFTLVKGATPKIRIVTTQPIKEPFLHFLVNAEWDDGNLLREYTALLDPPLYATNQPTAVSSPGLVEQAENMAASPPTGSTSGGTSAAGTAGPQSGTAPVFSSAEYGPTAKGDTLWSIASQFDTSGYNVNVFQVIAALLKENPDAFIDNNINRMKTGQILRLSDLDAVGKEDASRMYQAQMDQWESYKMEVAKNSELVNVPAAASSTESASPPTAAKTAESDPAAMADADDSEVTTTSSSEQDLLKIVRATLEEEAGQNEGAGKESAADAARADSAEEIGALREQITTLEESLVSTELQNRELQERVTLLEDQVVNAQRLVELESQELALVQQQAAQQQEERQLLEQQLLEQQAQADQALDEAEKAAAEQEAADKAEAELAVANQQAAAEQAVADKAEAELAAANQQAAAEKAQVEKELVEKAQAEKAQAEKVAAEQKAAADKASAEAKEVATTQQGEAASGEQATPVSTAQEQPAAAAKGKKTRIDSRKDDTTAAQKVARGPEPESWWQNIIDTIAGSSMSLIAGAVGLVVLLVAAILFIRRRRSIAEFEESILSGSGLNGQTDTTDTSAANPAGTDTSFLSDFGMAGMGSMQADEVDPLAEADVYLAYGRDEQAEEVLKEAVARDPGRYELKLKLLEIYQQRDDLKSFETLAEELYPAGGQGDPVTWAKVIKMGNKMNPHNPLFAQELSGGMADTVTSDDLGGPGSISLDLSGPPDVATMSDTELPQNIVGQSLGPIDPALHPFPAPDNNAGVDEELGRDVVQADSTSSRAGDADELKPLSSSEDPSDDDLPDFASNEKPDLGFEFELKGLDEALAKGTDNEPDELNMDDLIQLDIDEPKLETNSLGTDDGQDGQSMDEESELRMEEPDDASGAEELRTVPRDDVSREGVPREDDSREDDSREDDSREDDSREDVTRNFGVISGGGGAAGEAISNGGAKDTATDMETWDEAATKLDLAQAYLNMGDKAGARSIIDEVIKDGSPAQKNQAAELEAQLG